MQLHQRVLTHHLGEPFGSRSSSSLGRWSRCLWALLSTQKLYPRVQALGKSLFVAPVPTPELREEAVQDQIAKAVRRHSHPLTRSTAGLRTRPRYGARRPAWRARGDPARTTWSGAVAGRVGALRSGFSPQGPTPAASASSSPLPQWTCTRRSHLRGTGAVRGAAGGRRCYPCARAGYY
jgi:hypothetical protein